VCWRCSPGRCSRSRVLLEQPYSSTRNFLTFANATVIAYGQKTGQSLRILLAVFAKVRKLRVEMARRGAVLWAVPRHASQTLGSARAEEFVDEMD